jgi:hypothetical protein
MAKNYVINIENNEIDISFSNKVLQALQNMELDSYPIYGTILSLGVQILTLTHQEQFVIIDEFQRLAIVGIKDCKTLAIDIVSVVHMDSIYIKKDSKVFTYK